MTRRDRWVDYVAERALLPCEEPPQILPAWAARLRDAVGSWGASTAVESETYDPLAGPFASVWQPMVAHAKAALDRHPMARPDAHEAMVSGVSSWLSSELGSLGLHVLMHEFTRYRNGRACVGSRYHGSRAVYRAFNAGLREGGMIDLFIRYPMWARLVGSRLDHTIRAVARFVGHWASDHHELVQMFPEVAADRICQVEPGLSEPHDGGHTVIRLRFAEGATLYYKPRPPAGHSVVSMLLGRLHEALEEPPPVSGRTLSLEDHGWTGGIRHHRVESVDDGIAFHRRAGVLLFVLYLTGATDAHADNVIAHGTSPVFIDTECLLHPTLCAELFAGRSSDEGEGEGEEDSVARTGLLPRWARDSRGQWYSQAGLSDPRPFEPRRAYWTVDDCNTDAMTRRRAWTRGNTGANVPWVDAHAMSEPDRARIVSWGFRHAYRAFQRDADGLCGDLLERARSFRGRLVVRPTAHYTTLAQRLRCPTALVDGASAERTLQPLHQPFAPATAALRKAVSQLVSSEMRDLAAGDVPLFHCDARSDVVTEASGAAIHGLLEGSTLEALRSRIMRMGDPDLDRQCTTIRAAFEAHL